MSSRFSRRHAGRSAASTSKDRGRSAQNGAGKKRQRTRVPRYTPVQRIILSAIALIMVLMFLPSINTGIRQAQRIAALENDNAATSEEISDLQTKRDNLDKPEYVERLAREKYSYVKPGEEAYIVVSEDKETPNTHQANKGERHQPWYVELVDSLKTVGAATEE